MASTVQHKDIFFGNGYFVTVGQNGYLSYAASATPTTWISRALPTSETLNSVAFSGNEWVAVGTNGTILRGGLLPTTTFTQVTSGTTQNLTSVRYGNSMFVAVGANGTILTSSNGTTWTTQASGSVSNLVRVRWLTSEWVAVGENGTYLRGGTAGTTWVGGSQDSRRAVGIAYANGVYSTIYKTSTDGVTWTSNYNNVKDGAGNNYGTSLYDLVCFENTVYARSVAGAKFMALGNWREWATRGGDVIRMLHTSSDGVNYAYQATNASFGLYSAYLINNRIWAKGLGGSAGGLGTGQWTADDAATPWTYTSFTHYTGYSPGSWTPWLCVWTGTNYVMVGAVQDSATPSGFNHAVYRGTTTSSMSYVLRYTLNTPVFPFENWSTTINGVSTQNSMDGAYGNSTIVLTGPKRQSSTSTFPLHAIAWSNNEGSSWTHYVFTNSNPAQSTTADIGSRIAFGNGTFVISIRWAVSPLGRVAVTTTGASGSLTFYNTGFDSKVVEVKFLNGYFYALHDNGGISRSTNGTSWTVVSQPATWTGTNIRDVGRILNYTLLAGTGVTQVATNGVNFTDVSSPPITIEGAIFNEGSTLLFNGRNTSTGAYNTYRYNGTSYTIIGNTYGAATNNFFPIFSECASNGSVYVGSSSQGLIYSTDFGVTWALIPANEVPPSGSGIIIKDENGTVRLQSYDPTAANYLCTRFIKTVYINAPNTQINVPEANGYKIIAFPMPDFSSATAAGVNVMPYAEYHRGTAPDYQPYVIMRYPQYGGSFTATQIPANVAIFTTGQVEQGTY